jgi:hypothetical protein
MNYTWDSHPDTDISIGLPVKGKTVKLTDYWQIVSDHVTSRMTTGHLNTLYIYTYRWVSGNHLQTFKYQGDSSAHKVTSLLQHTYYFAICLTIVSLPKVNE